MTSTITSSFPSLLIIILERIGPTNISFYRASFPGFKFSLVSTSPTDVPTTETSLASRMVDAIVLLEKANETTSSTLARTGIPVRSSMILIV